MEYRFHEKAKRNGCFIVSAAGFDSVPADLGVLYTMQQFQDPAVPSSVTSFLSFQIGNAGICGELFSTKCFSNFVMIMSKLLHLTSIKTHANYTI